MPPFSFVASRSVLVGRILSAALALAFFGLLRLRLRCGLSSFGPLRPLLRLTRRRLLRSLLRPLLLLRCRLLLGALLLLLGSLCLRGGLLDALLLLLGALLFLLRPLLLLLSPLRRLLGALLLLLRPLLLLGGFLTTLAIPRA